MVHFAVDIVVIAKSEGDIEREEGTSDKTQVLTTSEIKINSAKTNILVCTRDPKIKADVYLT